RRDDMVRGRVVARRVSPLRAGLLPRDGVALTIVSPSELTAVDGIALRWATPADASILARTAAGFFIDTFGAVNRPEDIRVYLASAFSEARQLAELTN